MPRSGTLPPAQVETSAGLREIARRARRLARDTLDYEASVKLSELANELEARAATLEPIEVKAPTD